MGLQPAGIRDSLPFQSALACAIGAWEEPSYQFDDRNGGRPYAMARSAWPETEEECVLMAGVQPRPAATVTLVRESDGELEVLLLLRDRNLAFSPGCWVFPGGKIDEQDYQPGTGALEYHAARRAAVRETREEAGIEIPSQRLLHTAHWTTPDNLPLRYSTWFFLCPIYERVRVVVDDNEIRDHLWIRPAAALKPVSHRDLKLTHPTRATLQELVRFSSLDSLLKELAARPVQVFPQGSPHYRPIEMGVTDRPV